MARAIVRYSISGEPSNVSGNDVRARLEAAGFARHGRTAALEVDGATPANVMAALRDILTTLENLPGGGTLDHVWIYVDDADPSN